MARKRVSDYEAMAGEVEAKIRSAYESVGPALNGASAAPIRERFDPLHRAAMAVGQMPPQLSTLRARIGAILVAIVKRALFWYSPQIVRFQVGAAMEIERQYRLIQANAERILAQERALQSLALSAADENARLRRDLAALKQQLEKSCAAAPGGDAALKAPTDAASLPDERTDHMQRNRG